MFTNIPFAQAAMLDWKRSPVKRLLQATAVLISIALLWWLREPLIAILQVVRDREAVAAYLQQFGLLAPLLLSIVLVLQVIVAAIPGHALMIGGGYVYNFAFAFSISLAATVLGSQLAFLLARWAGRPLVERLAPVNLLNKWYDMSAQKGMLFFMFAFMLPIFPSDVMNYVAGLSSLSPRRFFIANLLGRFPGVMLMTAIGAYGFQLSLGVWIGIAIATIIMFIAWRKIFGSH
ncbi:MAG: TVP38/TMEM64 family protein [Ardenticatenaceae bacterium]|nr:TVP38/TMEM64 family protein [Ardenticatenaceae bacterium]MCB9005615.1 TVP38/TMEM64 family protein [Ardenticatenaceae bacterium]